MSEGWIVRKSGDHRIVTQKEYFINNDGIIDNWVVGSSSKKHEILSVTPIPTRVEVRNAFYYREDLSSGFDYWMAAYDELLGTPPNSPRPTVEDMTAKERREWIYG